MSAVTYAIAALQAAVAAEEKADAAALAQAQAALAVETADDAGKAAQIADLQKQLAAALALTVTPPPTGLPVGSLIFNDDASVPDLRLWNNTRDGEQLNYDLATVKAARAFKRDGLTVLQVANVGGTGRQWESSYLDTVGKFSYQYGYHEVCVQLPTTAGDSAGLWPAPLWERPDASAGTGGANDGEGDTLEAWGEPSTTGRTDYRAGSGQFTIHQSEATTHKKVSGWWTAAGKPRLSDDFHTFGRMWTPTSFQFFLDGKPVQYGGPFTSTTYPWFTTQFAGKFNLRCNFQVGQASYWGVPNAQTKPLAEMLIKHVRVWSYQP